MSKSDTLLAFLGGAALGAIIALLFSPAKGEENRTRIADLLRQHGINLDRENLDRLIAALEERFSHPSDSATVDNPLDTTTEHQ